MACMDSRYQPELVEQLIDGLRKAGLEIAGEEGVSTRSSTTDTKAIAESPRSIAILPFRDLSPDQDNEFFADGLTEEVIADLSVIRALRVISRTSAMHFKRTAKDLRAIARELDVRYVLEGSVRRAGTSLRITAQLIDAEHDSHLWAETYDRELADILEIQSEIAEKITGALKVEMSQDARARLGAGTRNAEAWQLYARGHQLWQARTEESIRQSIALLNRAIELDANFAQAHASLAAAHLISYFWYMHPDPSAFELSEAAAIRATALAGYLLAGKAATTVTLGVPRFEVRLAWEILKVALPGSVNTILTNANVMIVTSLVGSFGTLALAGYGAGARLEYLQIPLIFGMGTALVAMVGMNAGAGQHARARRVALTGADTTRPAPSPKPFRQHDPAFLCIRSRRHLGPHRTGPCGSA